MHPHAGGLIVCDGIEHANSISKALKHLTGEESVVVHSDTGKDARAIEKFTKDKTSNELVQRGLLEKVFGGVGPQQEPALRRGPEGSWPARELDGDGPQQQPALR